MADPTKEYVDILKPPTFEPSGVVKTLKQAWDDEEWTGTFNLWLIVDKPFEGIVYQVRSPHVNWAPGKLDVSCAGHYNAGETKLQGIRREAKEELGLTDIKEKDLVYLGRRLNVSPSTDGHTHKTVIDVYFTRKSVDISKMVLEADELYAITLLPIEKLEKVWQDKNYSFSAKAYNLEGKVIEVEVSYDKFPYNWDNYHYKIVKLAKRFLKREEVWI